MTDEENSLKRELEGMKTKEDNLNQEKKQLQQQRRELIEVQRTIRECHSREIPFNQLQVETIILFSLAFTTIIIHQSDSERVSSSTNLS